MSKSVGNVVDPMAVMKEYGVDVVRWYIVRVGGSGRGDVGKLLTLSLSFTGDTYAKAFFQIGPPVN